MITPKGDLKASLVAQMVKNLPAKQETGFNPWVRKILWRRAWQPTPVFMPRESHGQRSLAGYGPLGHIESSATEATLACMWWLRKQTLEPNYSHLKSLLLHLLAT